MRVARVGGDVSAAKMPDSVSYLLSLQDEGLSWAMPSVNTFLALLTDLAQFRHCRFDPRPRLR